MTVKCACSLVGNCGALHSCITPLYSRSSMIWLPVKAGNASSYTREWHVFQQCILSINKLLDAHQHHVFYFRLHSCQPVTILEAGNMQRPQPILHIRRQPRHLFRPHGQRAVPHLEAASIHLDVKSQMVRHSSADPFPHRRDMTR